MELAYNGYKELESQVRNYIEGKMEISLEDLIKSIIKEYKNLLRRV